MFTVYYLAGWSSELEMILNCSESGILDELNTFMASPTWLCLF